jgi:hypothetical protein
MSSENVACDFSEILSPRNAKRSNGRTRRRKSPGMTVLVNPGEITALSDRPWSALLTSGLVSGGVG